MLWGSPHPMASSGAPLPHLLQEGVPHTWCTAWDSSGCSSGLELRGKEEYPLFTDGRAKASKAQHLPHSTENARFLVFTPRSTQSSMQTGPVASSSPYGQRLAHNQCSGKCLLNEWMSAWMMPLPWLKFSTEARTWDRRPGSRPFFYWTIARLSGV